MRNPVKMVPQRELGEHHTSKHCQHLEEVERTQEIRKIRLKPLHVGN
jgi:hypothetical protein